MHRLAAGAVCVLACADARSVGAAGRLNGAAVNVDRAVIAALVAADPGVAGAAGRLQKAAVFALTVNIQRGGSGNIDPVFASERNVVRQNQVDRCACRNGDAVVAGQVLVNVIPAAACQLNR